MKRFLVFACETCYPTGGPGDFMRSFDTEDEAEDFVSRLECGMVEGERRWDWAEVMDTQALDSDYSQMKPQ